MSTRKNTRSYYVTYIQMVALVVIVSIGTTFAKVPGDDKGFQEQGVLRSDSIVYVGEDIAFDGATVLSDTRIRTLNKTASIQIPNVGIVRFEPNTSGLVSFDDRSITVDVSDGKAGMRVDRSIDGRILSRGGDVIRTDGSYSDIESDGTRSNNLQDDDDDDDKRRALWWLLGAGVGAVIVVVLVANNDDSPVSNVMP